MIDLYTWSTSNGHKVHIMLEEIGLPYTVHPVDIQQGEQFTPEFLAINPNNRIPAIIDRDGPGGKPYTLFESGAILMYLAEKTGKLMPRETGPRYQVIQWLMWQMGGVGPMFGQANHFRNYAREQVPYGIERYTNEAVRLYRVLEKQVAEQEYVAGEYSIADIALLPWCRNFDRRGQDPADWPNVKRWVDRLEARPAVQRGLDVLSEKGRVDHTNPEVWEMMFGKR
ncbi:MAG: glutathione S-transferase family protein [Alphaproteobacteria bacterium]